MMRFMRNSGILVLMLSFCMPEIFSQNVPIGLMRPLDDNHALATDSTDWKFHRAIKELSLAKGDPGLLLSFGGEVREQIRYFDHVNFGAGKVMMVFLNDMVALRIRFGAFADAKGRLQ